MTPDIGHDKARRVVSRLTCRFGSFILHENTMSVLRFLEPILEANFVTRVLSKNMIISNSPNAPEQADKAWETSTLHPIFFSEVKDPIYQPINKGDVIAKPGINMQLA